MIKSTGHPEALGISTLCNPDLIKHVNYPKNTSRVGVAVLIR